MTQYLRNSPLRKADLLPDPLRQLQNWLGDAQDAGMMEPTAMALATADRDARPSVRVVLFKGFHEGGLCFYTNYQGRKARDLEANPQAAASFWWDRLERQVRIEGRVQRLPRVISEDYFRRRPRESQLGAYVSRQSEVVDSRETLDRRWEALAQDYAGRDVPCPEYWGGYCLVPDTLEFWQGRVGRLHDRLRYRRDGEDWVIERLEP